MELTTKPFFKMGAVLVFILTSFAAELAFAQKGGRFSVGAMALIGQGKMGNGADIADRAMTHTPLAVFGGVNFKKFRLGLNYEYYMAGQTVDPAEVGGQNLSGKGTAPGLRLEFYDGKQSFGLIYRLSDTYTLDKPTITGATAVYKSKGGFQVQYYRQIKKRFGFVFDYTTESFDESASTPVKWDRISLGVVISNFTGGK